MFLILTFWTLLFKPMHSRGCARTRSCGTVVRKAIDPLLGGCETAWGFRPFEAVER